MDAPTLTLKEVERYLSLTGRRGASTLSLLGKLNPYFNSVINSEIGHQLLKDDIDRMEELLIKIWEEKEGDQEKAEFRYLRDKRFPEIIDKIKIYLEKIGEIKKVSGAI